MVNMTVFKKKKKQYVCLGWKKYWIINTDVDKSIELLLTCKGWQKTSEWTEWTWKTKKGPHLPLHPQTRLLPNVSFNRISIVKSKRIKTRVLFKYNWINVYFQSGRTWDVGLYNRKLIFSAIASMNWIQNKSLNFSTDKIYNMTQ